MVSLRTLSLFLSPCSRFNLLKKHSPTPSVFFSSSSTPYPLYYELISYRPARSPLSASRRGKPSPKSLREQPQNPESDMGIDDLADTELDTAETETPISGNASNSEEMDKSMRKYYQKRRKRMYGSDSDGENGRGEEKYIELKPEVIDFPRLHPREEELYFYDTFAFPWEKEKHYRMVYQLEKKYFPDQCLDKAFVDANEPPKEKKPSLSGAKKEKKEKGDGVGGGDGRDEKGLVFFEEESGARETGSSENVGVSDRKVEEFFKCLKKVPSAGEDPSGELYISTRTSGLPPRWDGPRGAVVMVNKPKGWTSFTVCGKLRRLVKVQKVGHAGTLDPMATGLLIVCVGKATKIVERFQGMIKGYSGVFRLGEATSTWDADSPVIQREPWEHIKDEDIKKAAASFCGEIWQVPPMFSAIKVGGEKMYEKARRGETIELSPRRISIFQFDIERSLNDRQNLIFRVTCSKGTYIRSLCADFGKALGSCAHLTALRRDSIGEYTVDDAWDFEELQQSIKKEFF
ncbi:Pseudouridine synthase II [Cinnamomum micranthum f. kanehirae]|uniref:tRNA pseudouridine(55) synthase n=1 Tax=Cinnamomum micranthum f. kanehirae TaxID=337451 RepID=A0A3S3N7R9_9MAGN|nr:Pseudouridine synthase II [Cinnamomum micranthum f. kanehirae]